MTRLLIIGREHPHYGATGTLLGEKPVEMSDGGQDLVHVKLDEPDLGADSCYAELADVVPVAASFSTTEAGR